MTEKKEGVDFVPVRAPLKERHPISSPYGRRTDPITHVERFHKGVDFPTAMGTPIYAPEPGTILRAEYKNDGAGRRVIILHSVSDTDRDYSFCTAYFHLSEIQVELGQKVPRGTVLGKTGGSRNDPQAGRTTGPHLHFETRIPAGYIPIEPVVIWDDVA